MMDKARIAAIAAALRCLNGGAGDAANPEEHAAVMSTAQSTAVPAGSSPWALYGRQNQMNLRGMMQRREKRRTR